MPEKVVTLASTTSPQAELDHAASDSWRAPFVPSEEKKAEPEPSATEGKTEAESETAATEQQPGTEKGKPEKPGNWQKRVDRLTARNKTIEGENAELRARLEAIESRLAEKPSNPAPAPKPAQNNGEPKLENYKNADEWMDARLEWRHQQQQQAEESAAATEDMRKTWDAHNARLSEARSRYDDFDEVAASFGNIEIPSNAALAIIEQDNSADITYYLATHAEEAKKLVDLRPMQQIAAIDRIAQKIAAGSGQTKPPTAAPKPRPVSQAPQPIKPVGGATTGSTVDPSQMSYQEYRRYRAGGGR